MKWITPDDEQNEPYILTKDEEQEILANAISREQNAFYYRHLALGENILQIDAKMAKKDWKAEIDTAELFCLCNANKHSRQWEMNRREEEKKLEVFNYEELRSKHTAKFIFNLMAWTSEQVHGKKLIVNNQTKNLITIISFFISKDTRFEKELGLSFKKGLLLRGVSGIGKTFLLQCVAKNEFNPISIFSMIGITESVKSEGNFTLPPPNKIIYLDDVGTEEPTVTHYGTKISFFKNFIETFYLNHPTSFDKLIISTNNSFSELESKYGFRVRSRVKDMFNIINVQGTDMRGNI